MFVDDPGLSIVAVDPGGTTGIAVWDSWGQKLYVDQIDAGRGRVARERVFGGVVESKRRVRAGKAVGDESEMELLDYIERGVCDVLCDVVLASGPLTVVICEDFILNWGRSDIAARSGGREGLSAVRIRMRLRAAMEVGGYLNGDAWRTWDGFGATGSDGRGVKLGRSGAVMGYKERLTDVEKWRLSGEVVSPAIWAGGGVKWVNRLPGTRFWLPGGEKVCVAWLREVGLWMRGMPHGMDALEHLLSFGRKLGMAGENLPKPERIWQPSDELRKGKVSTKFG